MCRARAPGKELAKPVTVIISYDIEAGDDETRIKRDIERALVEAGKKVLDLIEDTQIHKYTLTSNPALPAGSRYERTFTLRQSSRKKMTKVTLPTIRGTWRAITLYAADVLGSRAQQTPMFSSRWKSTEDVEAEVQPKAERITEIELETIK